MRDNSRRLSSHSFPGRSPAKGKRKEGVGQEGSKRKESSSGAATCRLAFLSRRPGSRLYEESHNGNLRFSLAFPSAPVRFLIPLLLFRVSHASSFLTLSFFVSHRVLCLLLHLARDSSRRAFSIGDRRNSSARSRKELMPIN